MNIGRYLPSTQFSVIALSVLLSGGLVYAAQVVTHPLQSSATISSATDSGSTDDASNWQATLDQIQANNADTSLQAPNPTAVNAMLSAAQSSNMTDTVARTILVKLSAAKSQGLGDDIPTQQDIISAATAAAQNSHTSTVTPYSASDLTVVTASPTSLHAYGNGVMQALNAHPEASEKATDIAIDYAIEGGDKTQVAKLAAIGAAYKGIAKDLAAVPVPQTLTPLDLQTINNFLTIAATYDDTRAIISDPVKGLGGLQTYESLMDSNAQVFTNIAQQLSKNGILFTKDEPGSAWSIFLGTKVTAGSQ